MDSSMEEYSDKLVKVTQLLRDKEPARLSISAISRELGINRVTLAKYLDLLQLSGEVEMVPFGKSKLFTTTKRNSYSMLLDVYSEPTVLVDTRGCIEVANKKFFKEFGIPAEKDVIGMSLFDLNLKIFSDFSIQKNIRRLINGSVYLKEMQYIEESTNRTFQIVFKPIMPERSSRTVLINVIDITGQTQREEELIILDKRLQAIFDTSSDAIILVDKDGSVLNANKASGDLFGIIGPYFPANMSIFNNIFNVPCFKDMIKYLVKCGVKNELCIVCDFDRLRLISQIPTSKSGLVYLQIVFVPISTNNNGRDASEYAVMLKDITVESEIIMKLNRNETMYRSCFENLYTGITIGKPTGDTNDLIYVDINKMGEKILRVNKEDVIGKWSLDAFPNLRKFYKYQKEYVDRYIDLWKTHDVTSLKMYEYVPPVKYYSGQTEPWFSHYIKMLPSGYLVSFITENFDKNMVQRSTIDDLLKQPVV